MIGVSDVRKIVKLSIISGKLRSDEPINVMLSSRSGSGKTMILKGFAMKNIVFCTDLTYKGVLNIMEKDKNITHILIPDFLKLTMKKQSTTANLISLLNSALDEGVGKIEMYNYSHDFEGRRLGLITATTRQSLRQNMVEWRSIGFLNRFLTVSYTYSEKTIAEINGFINAERQFGETIEKLKSKSVKFRGNSILFSQFNTLANGNFRSLKQYQALAKCNAINEGRDRVEQKDIDEILRLSHYINLNYNEI